MHPNGHYFHSPLYGLSGSSQQFINQVNILINIPAGATAVTPDYISDLLDKGFLLNTVGNRLFYGALPLLLWIFGPVLVFVCSVSMVPVLYNLDIVCYAAAGKRNTLAAGEANGDLNNV
ncbi:hypothetical protein SDJN03_01571, partial [Cucurbita argyrosperma subsp. sororia]